MADKNKNTDGEYDDGRVVAPMDVEGMPWHVRGGEKKSPDAPYGAPERMTAKESRAYAWGVVKAALLVAAVFALVYLLFILFCTNIWFA